MRPVFKWNDWLKEICTIQERVREKREVNVTRNYRLKAAFRIMLQLFLIVFFELCYGSFRSETFARDFDKGVSISTEKEAYQKISKALSNGEFKTAFISGDAKVGKAVCTGYAEAFDLIMEKLDIPCIVVRGQGLNRSGIMEGHAWNAVLYKGKMLYLDATWDDNGASAGYTYYLQSEGVFKREHKWKKKQYQMKYLKWA